MVVRLRDKALDPWLEIGRHHGQLGHPGKMGAVSTYVSTVREVNRGARIQAMTIEHYPGMAEKYLKAISEEAVQQWELVDNLIIHRYGSLLPYEPVMVVAVWAETWEDATEACTYIIEEVKEKAPFWAKETLDDRYRWVEKEPAPVERDFY